MNMSDWTELNWTFHVQGWRLPALPSDDLVAQSKLIKQMYNDMYKSTNTCTMTKTRRLGLRLIKT